MEDDQDEEVGPEGAPEEKAVRKGFEAFLVGELGFLVFGLRGHWHGAAVGEER